MRFGTVLAWAVVLPWAIWAVGRLLGLDRVWAFVPIVSFTPWAAAAAVLAAILALALKRRAAALVAVASVIALGAVLAPRAIGGADEPSEGAPSLRVLTLNLYGGGARSDAVVDLVERVRPDVLALQEASPEAEEALAAAGLGRLLPRREHADGAGTDTAVHARLRMRPMPSPVPHATAVLLRLAGGLRVELHAVHPRPPLREASVRAWEEVLRSMPTAGGGRLRVLAGDFNATLDHRELRRVIGRGYFDAAERSGDGLRTTWPVGRRFPPELTIDHVLADERMAVGDVSVHEVPGTDHRAVFAELFGRRG